LSAAPAPAYPEDPGRLPTGDLFALAAQQPKHPNPPTGFFFFSSYLAIDVFLLLDYVSCVDGLR